MSGDCFCSLLNMVSHLRSFRRKNCGKCRFSVHIGNQTAEASQETVELFFNTVDHRECHVDCLHLEDESNDVISQFAANEIAFFGKCGTCCENEPKILKTSNEFPKPFQFLGLCLNDVKS